LLRSHPVALNTFTGATLCASSDLFAQRIEHTRCGNVEGSYCLDYRRFLSSGIIGGAFGGFVYPMAYARLDLIWPGVNFASVLQKSMVEIATVGLFVNSISMSSRGLLAGRTREDVASHIVREMPMITLNDVRVWLPYNILAFTFIPAFIRPSSTALMEASWQTYISLRAHNYAPSIDSNLLHRRTRQIEAS